VPLLSHLTSCTPTQSNLHLANSLTAAVSEPDVYMSLTFQVPNLMSLFHCLDRSKVSIQVRVTCSCFVTKPVFYDEGLSAPHPNPMLENHPLSAVRDCLFNIFPTTLHIGGRATIRNLRTRHAAVTAPHLSRRFMSTHKNAEPLLDIFVSYLYYYQYDLCILNSFFIWNKNDRSYTLVKLRQAIIRVPSKNIAHTLYICVHGKMRRLL
jgi:hypothetical protein